MIYSVYKLTAPNGKCYIGMTKRDVERRWNNGNAYQHNVHLCNAISKYGWENFNKEVLFKSVSKAEAEEMERSLISRYDSTNRLYGYNILPGGNVSDGHTEETKRKISESMKQLQTDEVRERKSRDAKGRKMPDEFREKARQANLGNQNAKGCTRSPEVRAKMSAAQKLRYNSPEVRARLSASQKGRYVSPETRAKMSAARKGKVRIYDENGGFHYGMAEQSHSGDTTQTA